jgi:hypothetical protein
MKGRMITTGAAPLLAAVLLGTATSPGGAQTQEFLDPGKVVEGTIDSSGKVSYGFEASSPGVLTVVVRSANETDLFIVVTDGDGQPLPQGRSDQDLGGNPGAEQFATTLPRGGKYRVWIETYGEEASPFKIGVSWLPFPALGVPDDPDGSPGSAIPIRIGQDSRMDAIDGSDGDYWDGFVLKVEKAGTLTVATRAEEGDLILEAFKPGEFAEPMERSDQDLQGKGGNEALTLLVEGGEELYFRVSAFSEGASIPYRLQVGFIPN